MQEGEEKKSGGDRKRFNYRIYLLDKSTLGCQASKPAQSETKHPRRNSVIQMKYHLGGLKH